MNQHLSGTFDAAPGQTSSTLLGLTRELCRRQDESARVMDVFNDLMRDFLAARLQQASSASAVRRGDSAMVLYSETVARLQRRLADEGFDPGEPTGDFTERTSQALEAFQTDRNLEVTGLPDQQTLFALIVRTEG